MRTRRAIVAVMGGFLIGAPAGAEPGRRADFIARHRCEITSRLARIHAVGPVETSRDRFITIALRDEPQHYVQCIFHDRDAAMYCEASSGAYRYGAESALRLRQAPWSVAALQALGFRQRDPSENFSREVRLGTPPDVGIAADLMLAALHDGYGARTTTALEIRAPHGGSAKMECGTPVS